MKRVTLKATDNTLFDKKQSSIPETNPLFYYYYTKIRNNLQPLKQTHCFIFITQSKHVSVCQLQRSEYDKGRFWPNLRNCLYRYNIKHNH